MSRPDPAQRPANGFIVTIDGPAASGKSSTAERVAKALGFHHVDSGALYRTETARRLGIEDIRSPEVTADVSRVAKIPEVRDQVNAECRRLVNCHNVVADGRDMGHTVFPDAQLKVFLIAEAAERARRRLMQRLDREPEASEIAEEEKTLVARDARDAAQTVPAPDAVVLDTTHITQGEQVERIVALVRDRLSANGM